WGASPWGKGKGCVSVGQEQHLAGADQVRVVDLVAVGLEDLPPAAGLAVMPLRDRRQRVAGLDRVAAAAVSLRLGVGVADHVREVGLAGRPAAGLGVAAAADVAEVRAATAAAAAAAGLQ